MIIDFHTHAFADSIAEKAISKLCETAESESCTDGTVQGLKKKMEERGIDYGVLLPIATKPSQQRTINDWAASENKDCLISYGTVYPGAPDIAEELDRIKELGLKGLKLHPDYQNAFLFEEKMRPIYKRCGELGLPIIIHMGYDPVEPVLRHAMPAHLPEIMDSFPDLKVIAAHFGGMCAWEEVYHYIAGHKRIWLDTAYTAGYLSPESMSGIIKKHGAERVLFASDCPWHDPIEEIRLIDSLPVSDKEKDMIFYQNAAEFLGINV